MLSTTYCPTSITSLSMHANCQTFGHSSVVSLFSQLSEMYRSAVTVVTAHEPGNAPVSKAIRGASSASPTAHPCRSECKLASDRPADAIPRTAHLAHGAHTARNRMSHPGDVSRRGKVDSRVAHVRRCLRSAEGDLLFHPVLEGLLSFADHQMVEPHRGANNARTKGVDSNSVGSQLQRQRLCDSNGRPLRAAVCAHIRHAHLPRQSMQY